MDVVRSLLLNVMSDDMELCSLYSLPSEFRDVAHNVQKKREKCCGSLFFCTFAQNIFTLPIGPTGPTGLSVGRCNALALAIMRYIN